ncbi:uncharacterized protein LOC141620246 [Silene latifolia]|uniref:uncharacterized protein LOC141620246 n=1 Tax=Silene latifolia TaxID=37657 RepID=UPI003D78162F
MKICSWNIRGCNDPLKQQEITDFLWANKLDVLGVLETRIKEKNARKIIKSILNNYSVICNYDRYYNGRIWFIWNPITVTVIPLIYNAQFIHCALTHHATSQKLFITMALFSIKNTVTDWIVLGDFNVVRDVSERVNPTSPDLNDILDFNACLLNCHLEDVGGSGCEYTWSNKQDDSTRVWSKLDRALANPSWFSHFPATYAVFLPSGVYDHSPVLAWQHSVAGTVMYQIFDKLKHVKTSLRTLHKLRFRDFSSRVIEAKAALLACQQELQSCPLSQDLIHQERGFRRGNSNRSLGGLLIEMALRELGSLKLLRAFILAEDRDQLIKPVTVDEIKLALFSIGFGKSLGPDRFSSAFFKDSWDLTGQDLCKAVQEFFRTGKMSKQANSTLVALIPNKKTLQGVLPSMVGSEQAAFVQGRSIIENIMLSQSLLRNYTRKYITPRCLVKIDIQKAFDSLQWQFVENMLTALKFPDMFNKWIMGCISGSWFSIKVNGGAHGFFKGQSGMRQGDPLSPYLFVLSMEILSRYLRKLDTKPMVSLHPKCAKLKLTHLVFDDDLMLFTREDVPSVNGATEVYFGGVSGSVKAQILQCTGFTEGKFPFRYLGVPLNSAKNSREVYGALLTKLQNSLLHWSNSFLSYAGRIQILNSVIFGIANFWCASALLPKNIMKKINKICKDYFWNIEEGSKRMVFKSWQHICRPCQEGGFIVKELLSWNKALLTKWIWLLSTDNVGIWAAWNRAYTFPTASICHTTMKDRFSESMCSIIKVKDEIVDKVGSTEDAHWNKALRGRSIIPKHWVTAGFAAAKCLPTVDLLTTRGICIVNRCVLCKAQAESHRHLFFRCFYSQELWNGLLGWMDITSRSMDLGTKLQWIANSKGQRHWKHEWRKGCIAVVVYHLWQERNKRIFLGKESTVLHLLGRIKFVIRTKLTACLSTRSPLIEARLDTLIQQAGSIDHAKHLLCHPDYKQQIYDLLRQKGYVLPMYKTVGDSLNYPKHKIIGLLAFQNKLPTLDNLCRRGLQLVSRYVLCESHSECASHLFFDCSFSAAVWCTVAQWLGVPPMTSMTDISMWYKGHNRGESLVKRQRRCLLLCSIYQIWNERNRRVFKGLKTPPAGLIWKIKYLVTLRLSHIVE